MVHDNESLKNCSLAVPGKEGNTVASAIRMTGSSVPHSCRPPKRKEPPMASRGGSINTTRVVRETTRPLPLRLIRRLLTLKKVTELLPALNVFRQYSDNNENRDGYHHSNDRP